MRLPLAVCLGSQPDYRDGRDGADFGIRVGARKERWSFIVTDERRPSDAKIRPPRRGCPRGNWVATLALLALAGCHPKGGEKPRVEDAVVRLAAVSDRPAAGYFTLVGARADDRLLRIDSAVVNKIELHQVGMSGSVMTMRQMADLPLPAGATVKFEPGGNHAMLFGIDKRITSGTAIPMLFTFRSGARVEVEAKTIGAADDMAGMDH